MTALTQKRLHEVLTYDPVTGFFFNNHSRGAASRHNVAGGYNLQGYVTINLNYTRYFAHRLAFLYVTGSWPKGTVDHIDRNPANNAWSNLRDVSPYENMQNIVKPTKGTVVRGVSFDAARGKWRAQLFAYGKVCLSKRFEHFEDAVCARRSAEKIYHSIKQK